MIMLCAHCKSETYLGTIIASCLLPLENENLSCAPDFDRLRHGYCLAGFSKNLLLLTYGIL